MWTISGYWSDTSFSLKPQKLDHYCRPIAMKRSFRMLDIPSVPPEVKFVSLKCEQWNAPIEPEDQYSTDKQRRIQETVVGQGISAQS